MSDLPARDVAHTIDLATALGDVIVAAGGIRPGVPLTGPQLLAEADALCDEIERRAQVTKDLGAAARQLAQQVAERDAELDRLRQLLKTAWLMVRHDAYDAPGRISTAIRPFLEAHIAGEPWAAVTTPPRHRAPTVSP